MIVRRATRRTTSSRLRCAVAISVVSVIWITPWPAAAVIPAWTTLIEGRDGGNPIAIAASGDASFALLNGGDVDGDVCRLARLDGTGTVTWIRPLASGQEVGCVDMVADASGLYVAITANGPIDGVPGGDWWDSYVRKVGFDASVVWTRAFSSPASEFASSIGVANGNVVLGGWRTFASGHSDVGFVRTYGTDGTLAWTRLLDTDDDDVVTAVTADASGMYAAIWLAYANMVSIRAFDANGASTWVTPLAASGRTPVSAMASESGRIAVVGTTVGVFPGKTSAGGADAFVATFDAATGAESWVRQFGSMEDDGANAVAIGPAGLYVVGRTDGSLPRFQSRGGTDAFVRAYDRSGRRRWTRQFGTRAGDEALGAVADANGVNTLGNTAGNLGTGHIDVVAAFVRRWVPA
jgi:hypothetical protein